MTVTAEAPHQATGKTFVQQHELAVFFVLAFAFSWFFMIIDALGSHGVLPFRLPIVLLVVMGYMPTLAAVIVTGISSGRQGIGKLFRKLLIVRVGLGWYAFAIFGFALVAITAVALYNAFGPGPDLPILSPNAPDLPGWQLALAIIPMFIVVGLVNGEELAWRGFALPRRWYPVLFWVYSGPSFICRCSSH
jgi:membrane protease YdiL (CAAX protease family)